MGKRSSFERVERDFYPTPPEAVVPLIPHLLQGGVYFEPCAGNYDLIEHLNMAGQNCCGASDIDGSHHESCLSLDVFDLNMEHVAHDIDYFITNPPWDRKILHPLIVHLSRMAPTWLLFDADWMHTKQSADLIKYCSKIVSVGRVKWIPDSKMTGKDNCAWYLFGKEISDKTIFIGR